MPHSIHLSICHINPQKSNQHHLIDNNPTECTDKLMKPQNPKTLKPHNKQIFQHKKLWGKLSTQEQNNNNNNNNNNNT